MALYKYTSNLTKSAHDEFDSERAPKTVVHFSGIYRCGGCGVEIAMNASDLFPPAIHHKHLPTQGTIRWKLLVGVG